MLVSTGVFRKLHVFCMTQQAELDNNRFIIHAELPETWVRVPTGARHNSSTDFNPNNNHNNVLYETKTKSRKKENEGRPKPYKLRKIVVILIRSETGQFI
jgi:hypothetical protein